MIKEVNNNFKILLLFSINLHLSTYDSVSNTPVTTTISRPNSLIFRQNFFQNSSNGKRWVNMGLN